jgi:V-type H+-transporting ATPase subunit C
LNNDAYRLASHTVVDERSVDDYLLRGWTWNSGKYGIARNLRDIVDALVKVRVPHTSIALHVLIIAILS